MLQNLASYLLGATTTTSSGAAGGVDNGDSSSSRVALRTIDHDDGWTLVDRDSEGNSDGYSEEEDDDVMDDGLERVRLKRTGSNDSLKVQGHAMEESWFVTPPPCFSSTGPVQLRTSPLENLLIEHPSMSVYQRTGSRQPRRTPTPSEAPSEDLEAEEEEMEDNRGQPIVVVRMVPAPVAARRCNRAQALQLGQAQVSKSRQAQKVQIKKVAQQAARGFLNRHNKAREANGRNWLPRRKERCQGSARSHANNNRKC